MSIRYEVTVLDLINSVERSNRSLPLLLGGIPSSGGGEGGPPGGFIGYLPQTRVTYDYTEIAATGILSSGGTPTLYDNLNHIRKRLTVLEASGVGGSSALSVYDEGSLVATGVIIIDFLGNLVTATKPSQGRVSVTISGSTDTYQDKVSATDTTPDYLKNKIRAGTNVTITLVSGGANEFLQIAAATSGGSSTSKVKASSTDTTEDYLNLKLRTSPNITFTLVSGGANEFIQASGNFPDTKKVLVDSADTTEDFLKNKVRAGTNVSVTLVSGGANEFLQLATTATTDTKKVLVSSTDTTEDYLNLKLRSGFNVTFTLISGGANEFIQASGKFPDTKKVLVDSADTTEDFIKNKIRAGTNVTITLVSGGSNEFLQVAAVSSGGSSTSKVKASTTDTTEDYLNLKLRSGPNISFTLISGGSYEFLQASGTAFTDTKKVLATVTDTTEDFIRNKIRQGTNITITLVSGGANEFLQIAATVSGGSSTSKVKASTTDTTEDYLNLKLRSGPNVTFTLVSGGANEFIQASGNFPATSKVKISNTDTTEDFLRTKLRSSPNVVFTVVSGGANEFLQASGIGGGTDTKKVLATITDTTEDYIRTKIRPGSNVTITLVSGGSNEFLQVGASVSGGGSPGFQTLTTVGSGVSWDLSLGSGRVTVSGLMNMANPTNLGLGQHYFLSIVQLPASGNNTLAWNNKYKFSNNVAPTLSVYKGREDILPFECDGTYMYGLPIINNLTNQPITLDYLTNMQLWFKADKDVYSNAGGTTPCADGDTVYVWKDQSGNAFNASQSTAAARPTFKTNILNGKPVIRFDGADDVLAITSSLAGTGDNLSFFLVVIPDSNLPIGIWDSGDENSIRNFDGGKWDWFSGSPYVTMGLPGTNAVIMEFIHTFATYRSVDYYKNGTFISNNPTADTTTTLWENLAALGSINFGYAYYDGDIVEFILYKEALTNTHRQEVETYLKAKYGIV
jgi:hypothetical protein